MKRILLLCFMFLAIFSCKKADERTCWKSAGSDTQLEIQLESFNKLLLHERIEYVLVQDSLDKIVILGGENLVKHIDYSIKDGLLELTNNNRCAFLRSYKHKIKVEIHFSQLINIHFEGTEPMTNVGKLEFDWLTFLIRDGSGHVELNLNAKALHATISHGWGDFTFKGDVNYANLNIRSNAFCDTYGLNVIDSITAINNTQGDVKINTSNAKLKAEIDLDGNIYYKGIPTSIDLRKYGKGELIDAN